MFIDSAIAIPLTARDRQQATEFAQGQVTPAREIQTYRNALAVSAVKTYLGWLDVKVDIARSHSHRFRDRFALGVADLYLPGLGRLECLVIEAKADQCIIPTEVQEQRLGYVAVELDEAASEAKLVGFLPPQFVADRVSLSAFQSVDRLLEALEPRWVKLGNWLQQEFEQHWQSVQELATPQAQYAFMSNAATADSNVPQELLSALSTAQDDESRWKVVEQIWAIAPNHPETGVRRMSDLGFYLDGAAVGMMVALLPKSTGEYALLVRLYPMHSALLPEGLQLTGLYETGEPFLDAKSRGQDNYIQLKFSAEAGERFGIRVESGEAEITEFFIVPE